MKAETSREHGDALGLGDLLSEPYQRLPKYKLLIEGQSLVFRRLALTEDLMVGRTRAIHPSKRPQSSYLPFDRCPTCPHGQLQHS